MFTFSSAVTHRLEQILIAESSIDEQSLRAESIDDLTTVLRQFLSLSEISNLFVICAYGSSIEWCAFRTLSVSKFIR